MANYFARRASDRITGVVALAGGLVSAEQDTCTFARSVSATLVHGTTDDGLVRGWSRADAGSSDFPFGPDLFKFWADRQVTVP
jgi:hypothetical protein